MRQLRMTITSISVKENSPDLNPVDYRIWGLMQQRLYKTPVRDTIDLKKRLVDTWASIPQCVVDEAVDQWTATRMREGKRSPVRTSAPVINGFFSEPPDPHHNRLFSEPPTFSRRKHVTSVQYRLRVNLQRILVKADRMTTTLQLL